MYISAGNGYFLKNVDIFENEKKKDRKDKQLETNDNMHKKPIKNIFSHKAKLANQAKMAHFRKSDH